MIRGTTPTLEFKIPFRCTEIVALSIVVKQEDTIKVNKSIHDCTLEGNVISVQLTQSETLNLDSKYDSEIQLRVRRKDNTVLASKIWKIKTGEILSDTLI